MENNTNQITSNYCKRNCGFFGNQAFDGYCSKCYKEHVKRQNSGSAAGRVTPTGISVNNETTPIAAPVVTPIVQTPVATNASSLIVNTTNVPQPITSNNNVTFNLISTDIETNDNNNDNITSNENLKATIPTVQSTNSLNTLPENASSSSLSSSDGEKKSKRTRCNVDTCRRKLGLTGFDCRCGGIFCPEHRYSDKHSCQFDYREMGKEQIRKANPVVVADKIKKIN